MIAPRQEACRAYPVSIFIAGDAKVARMACREFCDKEGLCVTVTETSYIYTGGQEDGVIVGLINYPRFPATPGSIYATAAALAEKLCLVLGQQSYTVQTPDAAFWTSYREADRDRDGAEGGDANAAPVPQDRQARAEGIAQIGEQQ